MGKCIITVLGPIDSGEFGVTDFHEHLLCGPPAPYRDKDPDLVLDNEEAMQEELRRFRLSGGQALVDFSTVDYHRDILSAIRIARATGVHVVAVSGFNKGKYAASLVRGKTVAQVADEILAEFGHGIGDTGVRPHAVKAGSGLDEISPEEETMLRAAGRVHRETGAPVVTHTEAGTMALEQVEILRSEGVPPRRIVLGHLDRKLDWPYIKAVAETGCYLAFDQIGKEKYWPDRTRIEFIQRLVAAGHGQQLVLGGDYGRKSYLTAHGGGPGFPYLLWRFVPWLRETGLPAAAIDDLLVHNPRRALEVDA